MRSLPVCAPSSQCPFDGPNRQSFLKTFCMLLFYQSEISKSKLEMLIKCTTKQEYTFLGSNGVVLGSVILQWWCVTHRLMVGVRCYSKQSFLASKLRHELKEKVKTKWKHYKSMSAKTPFLARISGSWCIKPPAPMHSLCIMARHTTHKKMWCVWIWLIKGRGMMPFLWSTMCGQKHKYWNFFWIFQSITSITFYVCNTENSRGKN